MDTNRATTGIGHGWTRTTTTTDSNHGDAETRRRAAGADEDDGMFGTTGGMGDCSVGIVHYSFVGAGARGGGLGEWWVIAFGVGVGWNRRALGVGVFV